MASRATRSAGLVRGWRGKGALTSAVCALAVLAGVTAQPARACDNPPAPGLPSFVLGNSREYFSPPVARINPIQRNQLGGLDSGLASGQSDARRAKLALRLPTSLVAINLVANNVFVPVYTPKGRFSRTETGINNFVALLYLQSPHGTTPAYGVMPPVRVTTLAFGMLPVSATLRLSQPRTAPTATDPAGTPVPLVANVYEKIDVLGDRSSHLYDPAVSGQLVVHLTDVTVDGRPLGVSASCTTSRPASVSMAGKYDNGFPLTPGSYSPILGGDLYGRLSIPSFEGCRTASGDDLSPLLTNALSGDDTALHLYQGSVGQSQLGCVTTTTGTSLPCQQPKPLPQPTGPGQVPDQPRDWTADPPPPPLPLLPPPAPTTAAP